MRLSPQFTSELSYTIPYHIGTLQSVNFVYNKISFITYHHNSYWNLHVSINSVTLCTNLIRQLPSGLRCNPFWSILLQAVPIRFIISHHFSYQNLHVKIHSVLFCPNLIRWYLSNTIAYCHIASSLCSKPSWLY